MNITTLHNIDTEYSADSIEWCPHPDRQQYFVCGTYQLEENKNNELELPTRRKGRIYLYSYDCEKDSLNRAFIHETAAILDQKWCQYHNRSLLAAANGLGEIQLFELINNELKLITTKHLNPNCDSLLTLSLDWSTTDRSDQTRLVTSDSQGNISLVKLSDDQLVVERNWKGHYFEAWTCCFDKHNSNVIYTGGDDSFLHIFDIRSEEPHKSITNKSHIAGVTSLLSFDSNEYLLATGSYDENLRLFDTRSMKESITKLNLKGGIWRIRPDPFGKNLLLCACMYHNFSVVKLNEQSQSFDLIGEYFEHKSICYGADWCPVKTNSHAMIMATCSFYDNKLSLSQCIETKDVD